MSRVSDVLKAALEIAGNSGDKAELIALAGSLAEATQATVAALMAATIATAQDGRREDDTGKVLSMKHAAERLDLPLYTVREMGRRGELPVIHRGRRVLVSESALRAFARGQETPAQGLRRAR